MPTASTAPTAEPVLAPAAASKAKRIHLQPARMKGKEYAGRDFYAEIENGHTIEDVLQPEYWAHVVRKFTTGSVVLAVWSDGSCVAQLLVFGTGEGWARMLPLNVKTFEVRSVDPTPERGFYKIDHIASGWRVIHRDTAAVMASALRSRDEAERFIDDAIRVKKN